MFLLNAQRVVGIAFSFYLRQKMLFSLQKKGMFEQLVLTPLQFRFVEIVHVELPYERRKVVMFEVLGKNLFAEKVYVFDYKSVVVRFIPAYYMIRRFAVHNFE